MTRRRRTQKLPTMLMASALVLSCTAVWAARDFTPQAGTWVISEELNGKPGRGLAIDVQGNTFFMQVFGYEKNGEATFYTATGQMDGNAVSAPLMQYQGGRSFGSDARDAAEQGSPGQVKVSFANGLQGTVQFPGEPERAIQRFEMRSTDYLSRYWDKGRGRSFLVSTLDTNLAPAWYARMGLYKWEQSSEWELRIGGFQSYPSQTLACKQLQGKDEYRCANSQAQSSNDQDPYIRSVALRIVNVDVVGTVEVQGQGTFQTQQLMGIATVGDPGAAITGCATSNDLYVGDFVNCRAAVTPSSGTWLVEDELTYKPGRGIAVDVQNGMAVAQVFNYLPNGAPTFHMGSGSYEGVTTHFDLNRYQGGRTLGGPQANAELAESSGDFRLQFSEPGALRPLPNRVRGRMEFPAEPNKSIVRMALESGATTAEGLLGQWWLRFNAESAREEIKVVTLSRVEGNQALSEDGEVRCSRSDSGAPGRAGCEWNHNGLVYRAYVFQEAGNRSGSVLQLRDRHGNLMGLGDVRLE